MSDLQDPAAIENFESSYSSLLCEVPFDYGFPMAKSLQLKVKPLMLVVACFLVAAGLVAGCTYLMTMPAWNPHSQYDWTAAVGNSMEINANASTTINSLSPLAFF